MVKESLQIGFHLSANVLMQSPRGIHKVAVTFDRRRISSCNCTCNSAAYWCAHVVAVCLTRIHLPQSVILRAPVSESLSRLKREQLQKFAQYLISELPQQILPTAQKILDELLGSQPSAINSVCGAPDPTAGASANDQTSWYLDEKALHDNIKKILIKFCVPAPIVFSDVNYLTTVAPPAAAEWTSLLRPLRGREPEGMWNLLSIVREMYKRNDRNAIPLLEIITEECMSCEQILIWWFNTKVALLSGNSGYGFGGSGKHNNVNSNTHASQHACSSLCDEVVVLWRLAALNPGLAPHERDMLHNRFTTWHMKILEKVNKCRNGMSNQSNRNSSLKLDLEVFTGFKSAIEACYLDWDDYPMPGITYTNDLNPMYHCPFTCFRHGTDGQGESVPQVNSSKAVLNCEHPHSATHIHHHHHHHHHHHIPRMMGFNFHRVMSLNPVEYTPHSHIGARDGNRSSVSSEGFCENDDDVNIMRETRDNERFDSDSQECGGSDSSSNTSESNQGAAIRESTNSDSDGSSNNFAENAATPKAEEWTQNVPAAGSRRPSKDESTSSVNSESPQSGDEYNVYYYSPKEQDTFTNPNQKDDKLVEPDNKDAMFSSIKKCEDPWDVLFSRAEGLHAHGHSRDACTLGVKLAEELLANPPDLMIEIPLIPKRKGKKPQINPATHQLSCLASATLAKCAFLCSVLAEYSEHSHLAFKVGMFGLQMARPPASTKPLEVKIANQEAELVNLLKRIPLGHKELQILRDLANQLKDSTLRSKGEAMLPVMLANFIFDALVVPNMVGRDRVKVITMRLSSDEILGFEAAVNALGLKANVSEADHPLLCEGTRRQRGEIAISLLTFYKDDPWKIARIMDKLLDREVHQLLKTPILSSYYSNNPPTKSQFTNLRREDSDKIMTPLNHYVPMVEVLPTDPNCCSRPHSSTSAEVEQGMACLNLNQQGSMIAQTSSGIQGNSRSKEIRYKGKRVYPSIPNQPSEAGAHFMFELAKTVLIKAGGSSSTSLFTQPSTSQNHHGPNRALHMCAFQLGLYALGLHNCVSPNWLSRTYSSHVSWITGQAMEIGAAAISFLIDTWEGHLTPPEAVSMADRASRGCDPNMVRAAAELALSCLPHAHALNPNEIQRAILQCKEQSDDMLEHACLTVESAAKGGGVYPEVLFQVAKYWYELYVRQTPGGEHIMENELHQEPLVDPHGALVALIDSGPPDLQQMPPPANPPPVIANNPVVVTTAPPPYQHPVATTLSPMGMSIPYVSHYNFLHPQHPHVSYAGPIHPQTVPIHQPPPTHLQMYQFQYPPPGTSAQFNPSAPPPPYASLPPPPQVPFQLPSNPIPQYPMAAPPPTPANYAQAPPPSYTNMQTSAPPPHQLPPNIQYYGAAVAISQPSANLNVPTGHIYSLPIQAPPPNLPPPPPPQQAVVRAPHRQPQQLNQTQLRYLLTAYRVGMLALETLARRVHDDRPQAKYARNPPYGEDVKWLLRISKHLGTQYLHHFCVCAVNSIVSPFVLHDVAIEAAQYLSRNNPSLVMQHLRTALTPLVQKCQQMYIQCMHQKLYHLTTADYEDFVNIVCVARAAFQITPEGSTQFKEWLQSIRRSKSCKKDLWAQINTALQANTK
ncbi:hypothetical protein WA026_005817 [Henosepilachna vigintioctopunctata]|uniref:SWIM-type domain-containing protein n=1 Tax=Henosepilachna vigintioctopunctata TaxID=420089 RepID=A0AAW1TTZ1_9CUCU